MEITRDNENRATANIIGAYREGVVIINKTPFTRSLILTPTKIIDDWEPSSVKELRIDHFTQIFEFDPEIVVLGTGTEHVFLDQRFMLHLLQHGAGLETMGTQAACRTYNILLGEGRKIVAALLLPG